MKQTVRRFIFLYAFLSIHTTQPLFESFFEKLSFWWNDTNEEITTHEQVLTPGCQVSIHGKKGNIIISTSDSSTMKIQATKRGSDEEIKLTKVETLYTKSGVSIKTIPLKIDRQCAVDYDIIVPASTSITMAETTQGNINIEGIKTHTRAHTDYGSITVTNVTNDVHVSTKHGNIAIKNEHLTAKDKIIALADSGAIKFEIPSNTHATLYAKTNKGTVTSDQPVTLEPRTLTICQKSLAELKRDVRGALGHGGALVKLQTSRGNIRVVTS